MACSAHLVSEFSTFQPRHQILFQLSRHQLQVTHFSIRDQGQQRSRSFHSYILQAYSKKKRVETKRIKQEAPTHTRREEAPRRRKSHGANHSKTREDHNTRRPQEETKAAYCIRTHAGRADSARRGTRHSQPRAVARRAARQSPDASARRPHTAPAPHPLPATPNAQAQRILGYASFGLPDFLFASSFPRPFRRLSPSPAAPAPAPPPRTGRSSPWTRCSARPAASRRRPPSPSSPRSRC